MENQSENKCQQEFSLFTASSWCVPQITNNMPGENKSWQHFVQMRCLSGVTDFALPFVAQDRMPTERHRGHLLNCTVSIVRSAAGAEHGEAWILRSLRQDVQVWQARSLEVTVPEALHNSYSHGQYSWQTKRTWIT